jgi:hypothetical protein
MREQTPSKQPPVPELEAFCTTCPLAEEVSSLLSTLGFTLSFQMQEQVALVHLPVLPAQYHYKDAYGTEVIYLAGVRTV